jgi:F0F1-type ATP synthase assembly protein I
MSTGLGISVTMLSGPAVWGLIGYLIDRLAGTEKVFTAIGMVLGAGGAGYIVYLRFGKEPVGQGRGRAARSGGANPGSPAGGAPNEVER